MTSQEPRAVWWRRVDPWLLAWIAVTALVWGSRGFLNTLSRDSSFYLYAGQEVVAGNAPYEAVMNRAGPLAHLLPALGVAAGRVLGLGDVAGARALWFLIASATPALVYLLVRRGTGSQLAGSVGAATMLCFQGFATFAANGPGSKQPMVLFLLVAFLLLQRRRMTAAGIATGLATLTWQPVLFVALPAGLVVAALGHRDLRERAIAAFRFGLGGAVTLAVTVVGFAAVGALDAFVEGFWSANARYTDQPGALDGPLAAWELVVSANNWTSWVMASGCLAALVLGAWGGRAGARRQPFHTDALALAAATVTGLAWSLIAFNGPPDVFVMLPAAACGIGGAAGLLLHVGASRPRMHRAVAVSALAWVLVSLVATSQFMVTIRNTDLTAMRAGSEALFSALPDDATVFSAEAPQPLALAGKRSISRYVLFGNGMMSYIDGEREGGLTGYRAWLRQQAPTLVLGPTTGIRGFLRPLLRDYVAVGSGVRWVAYLRADVDLATRAQVMAVLARWDPGVVAQEE
ncbi:MAG: hypothetical protein WKF50_13585 [Nocardioides sp.]